MVWGKIFSFVFILFAASLLILYWFFPFTTTEFLVTSGNSNSNFTLGTSGSEEMQFYSNMRYSDARISYNIDMRKCTLKKREDMERAFEIVSEETVLEFYPVINNEEISITCDSKTKVNKDTRTFIAGEGGPTNITQTKNFNVILQGTILLLRESKCERPNVAVHELFHALGFGHSTNSNNIMYGVSKCSQTIGEDIPDLIKELYSIPSLSDLAFENVSAVMNGKYLDVEMSVRNHGLKDSLEAEIIIYADNKEIDRVDLSSLKIGYGRVITLTNVWVPKISVKELKFYIDYKSEEIEKENNVVLLEIKK